MSGMGDDEEEYHGPAELDFGDSAATVEAHVAGHFDPLVGAYRWVGRVSASPRVAEAVAAGATAVLVRTPEGHEGRGTLSGPDVWGGYRVEGTGAPPFAVPEVDPARD
ncbi:DUF4873 domain-containing protein [Streptomonospora sp. S1-112]|uniref:DUF4873 domain-containing protein n=1 Tax=Streptomonospora mangrovi TaxID=2883123 RepID=A0A9X3SBT2_9ACTN|nr:DUF4873 domain-containing protein [Streptomonospora mangrovi]MDA0562843.1 DUF4873 domain-containing protein [Streptomonospora mangrovi]